MPNYKVLKRKRIENGLSNIFQYPLTVVSATMGSGKTTAVKTFLENRKVNSIWVALTGERSTESQFWNKLCAAAAKYYPEIAKRLLEMGFPYNQYQMDQMIRAINDSGSDKKTVLVIDDYHLIEDNKQFEEFVELVVQEEIANFHIVLISRTRPDIGHTGLLSKGLCYYVDSSFLAFTTEEIEEYFRLMDCSHLTQKELEGITNYTAGWISAIYLILLGMKQGLRPEINSNINRLIEANLFNQLNDEAKEAMLGLSVFDNFTIKQAQVVLQNKNIRQIVNQLVDQNAFIEWDPQTGAYRLHNVLRDYLHAKLESSTLDINTIYMGAGHWYLVLGDYVTAFEYYHRAGRTEELLDHLSKMEDVSISFLGNDLMHNICNDLPQHYCYKYPMLFMQIALNFIVGGEEHLIRRGVKIVRAIAEYYGRPEGFALNLCDSIFAEIELIYVILSFNDIELMEEHARKAAALFHGGKSALILRHSEFTFGLPHFLYGYYKEPGKLQETLEKLTDHFAPDFLDGCGTGCEFLALAEAALETGQLEQVELYAMKSSYKAKTKMQIGIDICANFTLARLRLMEGRIEESREVMRKVKEMLSEQKPRLSIQNNMVFSTMIDLCDGYLSGCMKQAEFIPNWLRSGDFSYGAYMLRGMAFPCLIQGKAVLLSENWIALEILCESFKSKFDVMHNQLGILHNSIYAAIAQQKLYGMEAGIEALLPVLKEGQADGIIMPFAENGEYLLPMLERLKGRGGISPRYLNDLLSVCARYSENMKPRNQTSLTERETEVLKLLAEGLTQKEIAENLILSSSTIKRHLENIYQKLEVNNKISAIKKAKNLKLL
jgi:LuxR family maltose regulon positive regulatory protein